MNYILDTCVISELIKKNPNPRVLKWIASVEESSLFLSVLTFAEIHKGIEKLPDSKRKQKLHKWVNSDLKERFKNRIIDLDLKIATKWGEIQGQAELVGRPMSLIDSLIVATAAVYDFVVVTRNTKDMDNGNVTLLNPWL